MKIVLKNLICRICNGVDDVTKSKRMRTIKMLPQAKLALKNKRRLTGLKNDFVWVTTGLHIRSIKSCRRWSESRTLHG